MAPIYTANHVSSSNKTTPLFTLKGLKNLSPKPVTQCSIYGIPLEKQVAYTQYAANLSSFIHASVVNKRVIVSDQPRGYLNTANRLPLLAPPVSFTMQKEISHDQQEKLIRALGNGATKNKTGNTMIFTAPNIPMVMIDKVIATSTTHFNGNRETVSPMGIKAYHFLTNAFAEILRVHSYPAFTSESPKSIVELMALLSDEVNTAYYSLKTKKNETSLDRTPYSRYLQEKSDVTSMLSAALGGTEADDTKANSLQIAEGYAQTDGVDTVVYAKPPRTPTLNYGSSSTVPKSNGILFPYFAGLLQPDLQQMGHFVITHLFQLLGKTVKECQDVYASFRRGFNSLSTTDVGMALSHIAFGIELALSTQSRCYVIIESNTYQGFTILGARLAIFDSTSWTGAYPEDELSLDLSALDPHHSAVLHLVEMFQKLSDAGSYTGPAVTEATFSMPKELIPVFGGLKLDQIGDDEADIDRSLRCLNYMGDGYISRNPQSIAEMLETFFSDTIIELDRPTYIPSLRTPLASKAFILLSRFGPEAPSLWNEKGQEFPCTAKETSVISGNKRKVGELDVYGNLPSKIMVTPKPLSIAVKDLGKMVEMAMIKMDLKERAGRNRNMQVESELMRKRIWKALVTGLQESSAKKRKVVVEKRNAAAEGNFDDALNDLLG